MSQLAPAPGLVVDRNLALEVVRVTAAAALAASRWIGRGDKNAADGAAVEAMRKAFDTVAITGTVVTRTRATSGFASNAATTSKPSFSKPGYRNNAEPKFPAPTKITGCKCSRPNVSRIVFPNNSTGYPNPRVPNCPKYAKSFRNCAGFTPAAFAKVVELTISTPLSNSFCKQR